MKIAVFTPFVNNSAIGCVTNDIFTAIHSIYNIEVDIYTSQYENLIDTKLHVISYEIENLSESQLAEYDYCVYVLGNYLNFHRECYLASRLRAGIVVLHDQTMSSFWWSVFNYDSQQELWLSERELLFGQLPEYRELIWEEFVPKYDFLNMPYKVSLRPILENALCIFTHAKFFAEYIAENFSLPVEYAYIPLDSKPSNKEESTEFIDDIIEKAHAQGRKIIVSTGIVHPVKHCDKVATVLLRNKELRENICYILVGENGGGYCERLIKYSQNELNGSIHLLGRQPESIMFRAISEADICINLRYPNSEVCSLSMLEQMSFGKAVIVIGSGIFNEVPDDSVIKLEIDSNNFFAPEYNYKSDDYTEDYLEIDGELDEIEKVLHKLVCNRLDLAEIGETAIDFVKEHATIDNYVRRFISFTNDLPIQLKIRESQRRLIEKVKSSSVALFGVIGEIPHYIANLALDIDRQYNHQVVNFNKKSITLGIWYAFPGTNPTVDREGVSVFTGNLCEALAKDFDINFEIWVYSWNLEPVKRVFANVPSERLKFITEQNYPDILKAESHTVREFGEVNVFNYWQLSEVARVFSKADLFMPVIAYLDDVVYTEKPVAAVVHDLFSVYLRELFAVGEHSNEIYHDTLERVSNLARRNATIITTASSTLSKQVLPYIKNINITNTTMIRTPKNIPKRIEFLSEDVIRKVIGTRDPYLFYPTQVRPHKNFQLLISAFALLIEKYPNLKLVLTGMLNDVPTVQELSQKLKTEKSIILVSRLTTTQLYSCYKYAVCTPVSTMHEAVLSWQAIEAMSVGTPIVLTDADMNRDEIVAAKLSDTIPLIPENDEKAFANEIEYVMKNREVAVIRQEPLFTALTKYTWKDAAREYYTLFSKMICK